MLLGQNFDLRYPRAKQLGRRYIGIEIDPTYAKQADERVKQSGKG